MKKQFTMNDKQKAKYAELFTTALDTMEQCNYVKPWVAPNHGEPMNYKHKKAYKGMNNFFLTLLCSLKGWEAPYFLTFDQLTDMGLSLNIAMDKDGMPKFKDNGLPQFEGSFPVVKKLTTIYLDGKKITFEEYDALTDEEKDQCRWYPSLRTYPEFNLSQTNFKEKFPEKWQELTAVPEHDYAEGKRDEILERMIMQGEWRCKIEFKGHECYYSPSKDCICLPERSQFLGDAMFYATALHEMAHSTAPDVKRDVKGHFGDESYAMEEFVAELSSACVCSMLGIGKLLDENHIAYVQNWRQALKNDKDFIPKVIDEVQKATNYILRKYEDVAKEMKQPLRLAA
jgi:antirestriction protein ArdC